MHAWEIVCNEINFDEHSALVAVGGDGTLHEVINGMLFRADKKKLPVSFIPHGTGNDLVGCLGTRDVEQALNWLAKGDTIKMDVNKVLIDVEDEADIPETEERHSKFRYSVINSGVGLIAKITHSAVYHKPYMGKLCYFTSGCTNAFTSTVDYYDIIIGQPDGSEIELYNEATMYLLVMNGKLGGGRMLLSPHALLNDGLLDITMQHGPAGKREVLKYIKNCVVQKGMMIYKENYACFRGKWVKIVNRNMATEPVTSSSDSDHLGIEEADRKKEHLATSEESKEQTDEQGEPQKYQIDGEPLWFKNFVKLEVVPGAVDVIVNYEEMMRQTGIFKENQQSESSSTL